MDTATKRPYIHLFAGLGMYNRPPPHNILSLAHSPDAPCTEHTHQKQWRQQIKRRPRRKLPTLSTGLRAATSGAFTLLYLLL